MHCHFAICNNGVLTYYVYLKASIEPLQLVSSSYSVYHPVISIPFLAFPELYISAISLTTIIIIEFAFYRKSLQCPKAAIIATFYLCLKWIKNT